MARFHICLSIQDFILQKDYCNQSYCEILFYRWSLAFLGRSAVIQVFILPLGIVGLNITQFLFTFYLHSTDPTPTDHVLKGAN